MQNFDENEVNIRLILNGVILEARGVETYYATPEGLFAALLVAIEDRGPGAAEYGVVFVAPEPVETFVAP